MLTYIIRRLLLMIPTIFGITLVVFFVMALSPGGVAGGLLNEQGELSSEQNRSKLEYYNERYGLDKPYVVQYGLWLNQISPVGWETRFKEGKRVFGDFGFKVPDLGESFTRFRPVTDLYLEALPITLLLNALALPMIYGISIISGVYAAKHRGSIFDVVSGTSFIALWSMPSIWVGVLLLGYLANDKYLHFFPSGGLSSTFASSYAFLPSWGESGFQRGWLLDRTWHLLLPVLCLSYGSFAFLSKLMRASVLENLNADFVRTARAKGVNAKNSLWKHAFRNSLLPLITVAAGIIPGLIAGSVIVENIFSIQGMGKLMVEAIFARDRDLVLGGVLISSVISLLCILVADLCYVFADPRVSYE
ncbi:Inner membrane ABC transporter permease protein YejB [Poriferisphaera corsica]|uniref:Inner membrane ABC transporter permease protein YejB n=1 Tax=Poriferisphaera corsica TaxID=2528020 RepID=A0A517YWV2_9BACT|nr:ABC transporter permease [Poriferisphaera corsica]QDU34679.1 Inner membrane ABC transporter permease protein YejB [Poriferisphaera corsica]